MCTLKKKFARVILLVALAKSFVPFSDKIFLKIQNFNFLYFFISSFESDAKYVVLLHHHKYS